nr:SigE family RNA polymerase sigma factor [Nocardioides dongkuii]
MDVGVTDFEAWAETRLAGLLRFAYLVTGSQQAAEEAVQSALTRACERWSRVSRTEDPDAYVRRMVVNEHVSGWRRAGRREVPVAEVRDQVRDTAVDPTALVDESDAVWRVCSTLPRQQRAAVVLRFYEDLEYAEVASLLGCSESTVRSHVHRALTALRAALTTQEDR